MGVRFLRLGTLRAGCATAGRASTGLASVAGWAGNTAATSSIALPLQSSSNES